MKNIITFLFFGSLFVFANAQDSAKVDTPKIISKLKVGNTVSFNSKSLKFIKLIEDSRCPSDVTCFWPGEAKIKIGIYEGSKLLEEKELVFGAKAIHPENIKEVLVSNDKTVYGYTISPYPTYESPIDPKEYYLEFLVK